MQYFPQQLSKSATEGQLWMKYMVKNRN